MARFGLVWRNGYYFLLAEVGVRVRGAPNRIRCWFIGWLVVSWACCLFHEESSGHGEEELRLSVSFCAAHV